MNQENLKPFNTLTEEKQREIASKGGKASVEARRKKKVFKEAIEKQLGHNLSKISLAMNVVPNINANPFIVPIMIYDKVIYYTSLYL